MREFTALQFIEHLGTLAATMPMAEHHALEVASEIVEKTAKEYIGQEKSFWPPLAESTIEEKQRLGYVGQVSATDPLLRKGDMRDSIEHIVHVPEAEIGTNDQTMVYHENGTSKMPARPVFAHVAKDKGEEIAEICGRTVYAHLI